MSGGKGIGYGNTAFWHEKISNISETEQDKDIVKNYYWVSI